jgi:hypothetical protein
MVMIMTRSCYANDSVNSNDNDNVNVNVNANANDFVGRSRVSCFSLDSPRPWPGSALLAPFRLAGARWGTLLSWGKTCLLDKMSL